MKSKKRLTKTCHFEGRYFKQQGPDGAVAFIPALHTDKNGKQSASFVFFVLPKDLGNQLSSVFSPPVDKARAEGLRRNVIMRLDFAAKALSDVSAAVDNVAKKMKEISWILIIVGLFLPVQYDWVLYLGILFYAASVVFTVVTLPVEFNASKRALAAIRNSTMLEGNEYSGARSVLSAAAMTYVAAAFTAIMSLLRLLVIANRRRN